MEKSKRVEWLYKAKWGVFMHYLGSMYFDPGIDNPMKANRPPNNPSSEEWNAQIDNFDVKRLVSQLVDIECKYFVFTIGQISGHYASPNSTYDEITGVIPSKCSKRDLVKDLYTELHHHGIKLMVYFTGDAPRLDKKATKALEWKIWKPWWEKLARYSKKPKLENFQRKWESIIREYSLRWGKNIHGWWIDGCYTPKSMYGKKREPNIHSFANALRAGNPDSIITFNPGVKVPVICNTVEEDYTAGEIAEELPDCPGRWVKQAQYHILTYLGSFWGHGHPRFTAKFVRDYTQKTNSKGGVVTWDVTPTRRGTIKESHMKVLKNLISSE